MQKKLLHKFWQGTSCVFFIVLAVQAGAQGQYPQLSRFLDDKSLKGASVGVMVSDVTSGDVIMSSGENLFLAPASVSKLFTASAALELLGPYYRFQTFLAVTGPISENDSTLKGDLVVKGGGDPTIGSEWFSEESGDCLGLWVKGIKNAGIAKVTGNLIIDHSKFEGYPLPGTWMWEDIGNYYGAGAYAVNIYDNTVRLFFDSPAKSGLATKIVSAKPVLQGFDWFNLVRSSSVNRDLAYVFGSPWDEKRIVSGTIPANRRSFSVKAAMPNPPLAFGRLLKEQLASSGISVSGEVSVLYEEMGAKELVRFSSPPLFRVCSVLNHESVNLIAESLVLQLAYAQNGYGSHKGGMEIISRFINQKITGDTLFLEDGSGLSRFTSVTARQVNDLLLFMHRGQNAGYFKETLPIAGSGTLKSFPVGDFPGKTLRCKSGSMRRVRAYAGYLICRSGREVAFTIIANNFPATQQEVFKAITALLLDIWEKN